MDISKPRECHKRQTVYRNYDQKGGNFTSGILYEITVKVLGSFNVKLAT